MEPKQDSGRPGHLRHCLQVIFDGGTYSRGPARLLAAEDAAHASAAAARRERLERQLDLPLVSALDRLNAANSVHVMSADEGLWCSA